MKTGILGGTFNPIHVGHLINAQMIAEEFALDRVLFIPSGVPVHKPLAGNATNEDRYRMVALAIRDSVVFKASDCEIIRDTPSYTLFTIQELQRSLPGDRLYMIIGLDAYLDIHAWHRFEEILVAAPIIVMNRPGDDQGRRTDIPEHEYYRASNPRIQISSSLIRDRVRAGRSIRYLVPPAVEDYITQRGLYTS